MSEFVRTAPEFGLVQAIKDATNLSHELKGAKRLSGASGQLNYTGQSGNTWDITQTVTNANWTTLELTATLTGDGTQDWFEAQAYLDIRANGTADANRFSYLNGTYVGTTFAGGYGWTDGTNIITHGGVTRNYNSVTKKFTWVMTFTFKGTITYYTKIVIRSS